MVQISLKNGTHWGKKWYGWEPYEKRARIDAYHFSFFVPLKFFFGSYIKIVSSLLWKSVIILVKLFYNTYNLVNYLNRVVRIEVKY